MNRLSAGRPYGWRDTRPSRHVMSMRGTIVRTLRTYCARRVLDIGCGNGALVHILSQYRFDVTGIDPDEKGIQLASTGPGHFIQVSCYEDPTELGLVNFDAATCLEVIEHLYSPDSALQFARKALKPGGLLILSTPYHGYLKNLAISLVNGWDRHWNPLREGGHVKFFSSRTLKKLIEQNGFNTIRLHGIGRIPYLWKSIVVVSRLNVTLGGDT